MKLDADGRENGLYGNYLRQGKEREEKNMKAISKRVLSFALALVMVLTLAVVPSAEAQAATGLAKSKTYYVGQTKTLKLTTSSDWKKVKTTWKSSKPSVVKISKSATKSASIKCVKAGTANVTAKVSYKKDGKTSSKTFTCKVTVKDPTFDVSIDATTLTVGETTRINVVKTPKSGVVKYSSDDAAIAKISGGKIYANAAGTTNINARLKVGSKSIRKSIPVTVVPATEGLSVTIANPLSADYPNTVLVNQKAVLNVLYAKDGKPVAGETAVIIEKDKDGDAAAAGNYLVKGNRTATTNSKGIATFIVGNVNDTLKPNAVNEKATRTFEISIPGEGTTTEFTVCFAALQISDITVKNGTDKDANGNYIYPSLKPGTNYKNNLNETGNPVAKTASMDDPTDLSDQYVMSQQVSAMGGSEHAVTFHGGYPEIVFPKTVTSDFSAAEKKVDPIDVVYGPYGTYKTESKYIELTENVDKLTYATVKFDYLKLSKYTHAEIATYASMDDAVKGNNPKGRQTYEGAQNQGAFNYQVPLENGAAKVVKVTVCSEGQVDAAMNVGYKASSVEYVFKKKVTDGGKVLPLKGGAVKWDIVDTEYTAELPVPDGYKVGTKYVIANKTITMGANHTLTYKMPRFPYTGAAVLTHYDANGKVVAYYAYITKNNGQNQNELGSQGINDNNLCYEITEDELRTKVGMIQSQDGSYVTVNSYQSGRTTLEGKVEVNGKVLEGLDAETSTVYTSVQWNPIPNTTSTDNSADAFVAFVGQNIEVVAQLVDKNGNAVTQAGQNVTFYYNNEAKDPKKTAVTTTDGTIKSVAALPNVTVVKVDATTDSKGQAKLILKASDVTGLDKICVEAANSNYDARLNVAGKDVVKADLYWVNAELVFIDKSINGNRTATTSTDTIKEVVDGIAPLSGSKWLYAVKAESGILPAVGNLAGKTVTIDGLDITMAKAASGVGAVEKTTNPGEVLATSTKSGKMVIVSKITSASVNANTTIKADNATFAGTGKASIGRTLKLNVNWTTNGMVAEVLAPNGNVVANNYDYKTKVYVNVSDVNGNPVTNEVVTFKVDNANATMTEESDTPNDNKVKTDANGIACIDLDLTNAAITDNTNVTVSASVDGISGEVYSMTYVKKTITPSFVIDDRQDDITEKYQSTFDKDTKTITLVFKDDIVESSVIADAITARYVEEVSGNDIEKSVNMGVDSVTVDGNIVTIKVVNVPSTVDADKFVTVAFETKKDKSVEYTMTSVKGEKYTKTVTFVADGGKTKPVEDNNGFKNPKN